MLKRGIAAVTRPGDPLGCMISSGMLMAGPDNAALVEELKARRRATRDALEKRIARDIAEGRLPETVEPEALARFYALVLQGISAQALDGADREALQAAADLALSAWPGGATAMSEDRGDAAI